MTDTVRAPLEMNANGAAPAPEAVVKARIRRATSIPESRLVPENPLGSGHLVFMPRS